MFSQIIGGEIIHTETYDNGSIEKITYHKQVLVKGVNMIFPVKLEEYYKDGQLYKLENYSKKFPYGYKESTTEWYKSGEKMEESTYKDGEIDGLRTRWYENGKKDREVHYKDGKENGLYTTWYENGKKKWEGNYKDGEMISSKRWNEDGSVKK